MPPTGRRSRHQVASDGEEERRPRQRQRRAEPESEEEDGDAMEEDEPQPGAGESADALLVKKLVRYALACDFSRTPIRRDGIKEKVLGDQGRAFRRVFEGAQKTLRGVFGMEMVELPARDKLTKEERRKAAKSQNKVVNSNAYGLVSMLPEPYRTSKIIVPSRFVSAEEEAAYIGFYTLVITLIRINGGELSAAMLTRYLRRLNAEVNTFNDTKTEDTLAKLQRQGYLIKNVDRDAKARGEGDTHTTWHIGPRGKVEVSDEAVAALIRAVWGPAEQDVIEQLEAKLQANLNIRDRDLELAEGEEEEDEADEEDSRMENADQVEEAGPSRRRTRRG